MTPGMEGGVAVRLDADGKPMVEDIASKRAYEATPIEERFSYRNTLEVLAATVAARPAAPAITFQLKGDAKAPTFTWTYAAFQAEVFRLANALKELGAQEGDAIALILPNIPETAAAFYAGQAIGAVNPINPLLEPDVIAGILRDSDASVVITLAPFPKTDLAEKTAQAVRHAPNVKTIIEIDLLKYLTGPTKLIAPLLRPKRATQTDAKRVAYAAATRKQPSDRLIFERDITPETIGALFHTGGTTGAPKLAQHEQRGMVFNPWMIQELIVRPSDAILCALPLFHVFAGVVMLMPAVTAGAHLVLATPSGFRGEGVVDNFWKLVERYKVAFLGIVPTAIAALDQRPVNADISSLRFMLSGSAPLPTALFQRFERNADVRILEGYGMTEATCVTSCNPCYGVTKIGSVGIPLPYMEARIAQFDGEGNWLRDCETDEIGEICFDGPCIFPGYKQTERNAKVFFDAQPGERGWLRTGDLGRIDPDGFIWITGRAKDVIIRGGHNIDPGLIEEALAAHPAVAFVGAIGQPDAYAGEVPCAYVELKEGATADPDELAAFAAEHVSERAARPAHVAIMDELPKTAVGKTFKPALRREAIARVFEAALKEAGVAARVSVEDDDKRGMMAVIHAEGTIDETAVRTALSGFSNPWRIGAMA